MRNWLHGRRICSTLHPPSTGRAVGLALALLLGGLPRLQALSLVDLRREVRQQLEDPAFAQGWWGVYIESLDTGQVLFSTNGHRLLPSASTAKLFIAALALDHLGSAYRIPTTLHAHDLPGPDGILAGDLIVRGQGDFSFATRFNQGPAAPTLDRVIVAARAAGIRRIAGNLIGDNRWLQSPPWGAGWAWDDLARAYAAEASALVFDDNTVDVIVGPGPEPGTLGALRETAPIPSLNLVNRLRTGNRETTARLDFLRFPGKPEVWGTGTLAVGERERVVQLAVPDPAGRFLKHLRDRFHEAGITVEGDLRVLDWPADALGGPDPESMKEIGRTHSPPLANLVEAMLKSSNNLYAQLLLAQVGAARNQQLAPGSPEAAPDPISSGLQALPSWANRLGIDPAEVQLVDAAGLTRCSRISPAALVGLLRAMDRHPARDDFHAGLPIAGVDGTLQHRMRGTRAAGNLRAKTGTLSDVATLAGRVTSRAGETLVFALMLHSSPTRPSGPGAPEALDRIAVALANLDEMSR